MGDWQNIMSMSGDYSPWDSPGWNDDWEHDLREDGYLTVQEWNALGKIVKKGEKGRFLPSARIMVFTEAQTEPSQAAVKGTGPIASHHFETFGEAMDWAKQNPGRPISRSPGGNGFIAK